MHEALIIEKRKAAWTIYKQNIAFEAKIYAIKHLIKKAYQISNICII